MSHCNIIVAILFVLLSGLSACQEDQRESPFMSLPAVATGIHFNNKITETETINYFTYPYLYMGGGVAIGDINQDGLQDIYFTSNMGENKLYLNQSQNNQLKFKDITLSAGVAGDDRWDTGVVMADVNADGWLDIYVSVSGKWTTTKNQLFINNGDLTFSEQAESFGIADQGQSTQAAFFDYDRDGDLDVYVVNYPPLDFKSPNFVYSQNSRTPKNQTTDRLYKNDNNHFTDVTETMGVLNFGLGLNVSTADFNQDGWPDIYVSNDFAAADFLYLNENGQGFKNVISMVTGHTSFYGMGTDVADINNDGLLDIFQADMTPADNFRSKANMSGMNPQGFWEMIDLGLHYQYMENSLQLHQGTDNNGTPRFGDISRMTGTAITDWSWSPLLADFDNDGWKDLHITNGTRRDINNKDYFKKIKNNTNSSNLNKSLGIPSKRIPNYFFKNNGNLNFTENGGAWGLNFAGFSNGSAYADLDNDGDLDLVTNNVDDPASIYQNNHSGQNWLRIKFKGPQGNQLGLDTKVKIVYGSSIQFAENKTTRGFQSSSEPILHFGLGQTEKIDQVLITWFDGKTETLNDITVNQMLMVEYTDARKSKEESSKPTALFTKSEDPAITFHHRENKDTDFENERLLPHSTSRFGPGLATGDINRDGLTDVYIGGAKGQPGGLFIQEKEEIFSKSQISLMETDQGHEDLDALFFDANGDGWEDLYVVSGGNEAAAGSDYYQDRLYLNQKGTLIKSNQHLPKVNSSGSKVKACDFDKDGDLDLLISGRLTPQHYGQSATSFLLINDQENGDFIFRDGTAEYFPDGEQLGMVTDFTWVDFDNDGATDLVFVGEWMSVRFFKNNQGIFKEINKDETNRGWWFSIASSDFNGDGRSDFILGNLGLNYKYQATPEAPFELYVNDFDKNQQRDIVLSYHYEGEKFPVRGRQCSSEQMPEIEKKFKTYNDFAAANLATIYSEEALENSELHLSVNSFASQIWLSDDEGGYQKQNLPSICQLSSINSILIEDFDKDGYKDLLLAGNLFSSEVETKRNDAGIGQLLKGKGQFTPISHAQSGIRLDKDVKNISTLKTKKENLLLIANNNYALEIYKLNSLK